MPKLRLPKFLNIPPKLIPIITEFDDYKYFLIEGGRGSAKSQSVARLVCYIGDQRNARIVYGREFQANIKESVHALLSDLIREFALNYEILVSEIRHKLSGTIMAFRGFRDQGKVNIKGLEGVDILVIDEAQSITRQTLNILIPTIRTENAKVFFVMNRYVKDDPVFEEFADRDDCLHIHIDYDENPHCPETLKIEAAICKARNMEEYLHIWKGEPMAQANTAAFRNVEGIIDYDLPITTRPNPHFNYSFGSDFAKSIDHTSISGMCIELKQLHYFEEMENENKASWNYQKEKVRAITKLYNDALLVTDSTGVGDPLTEDLQRAGVNVYVNTVGDTNPKEVAGFKFTQPSKKNLIEKLKIAIELQCFRIPNIPKLIKQLVQYEAIIMPSGKVKYGAPAGKDTEGNALFHDDNVISLALALWGTGDMLYDPEYEAPKEKTQTDRFWEHIKRDVSKRDSQNNTGQMDYFDVNIDSIDESQATPIGE